MCLPAHQRPRRHDRILWRTRHHNVASVLLVAPYAAVWIGYGSPFEQVGPHQLSNFAIASHPLRYIRRSWLTVSGETAYPDAMRPVTRLASSPTGVLRLPAGPHHTAKLDSSSAVARLRLWVWGSPGQIPPATP